MANLIKLKGKRELNQLIARAKKEQWRELILLGPEAESWYADLLGDVPVYQLGQYMDDLPQKLSTLTSLTSLNLTLNEIGDEGARAIATLSNLTSLSLWDNDIGAEGARALGTLSNLTSLDLNLNDIGSEGLRALANLSNLTSLQLAGNKIGAEGARALANLSNLTSLQLAGNKIGAEGAWALANLSNLTSLALGGNNIGADGARAIATLSNLTSLSLWDNNIGSEGARALATLSNLTSLDLRENRIGDAGMRALGTLSNLTSLDLSDNNIEAEGARALANLSNLTSLNLRWNNIGDEGVRALATLFNLTSLNLYNNKIGVEGAWGLANLSNLTSLNLRWNNIGDEGARAIATLSNLTSLDLFGNNIGEEGARMFLDVWCKRSNAERLKTLDLRENPLKTLPLPAETIESCDAQAILAAWRAIIASEEKGQLRPLNAAKLLVVGSEAVGKTSLVKYLTTGMARNPDEKKTEGTAIHERIEISGWSPDGSEMKVNIWDFGGQEIMHGTHRYFLTQRSLYLIVLEDRREDNCPIQDWLHIIVNRAVAAPVIVIINKSDDGREMLLLSQEALKRDNPNIVAFHRTACNADEWSENSIKALRTSIANTLKEHPSLEEMRKPVPASWLWVKEEMTKAAKAKKVLRLANFESLCKEVPTTERASDQDLRSPDERRALLRLLHDLGVVVAYGFKPGDLVVKQETVLLDPNWLTGAIYTILNHRTLRDQKGIFHKSQLSLWLHPEIYPLDRHEYILTMMQEEDLGLCFPLPGTPDQFLVPEGLPAEIPGIHIDDFCKEGCLRFRYQYHKLLPSGLIPRFIVEAHKKLESVPICWLTGAVFEAAECRVLVSANRDKRVVEIAVKGPITRQRDALNIIVNDLEQVHRLNGDLGVEARVPLSEQPEVDESYDHMLVLEAEEGSESFHRPTGAKRKYKIKELLNGVRRDPNGKHENEERKPTIIFERDVRDVTIMQTDGDNTQVVGRDKKRKTKSMPSH